MKNMKDYLHDRYLNTTLHTAWVDEEENLVTLPIWNLAGQMLGYIRHRPTGTKASALNDPKNSKYYTIMQKQTPTFWGLESWNLSNTLFLLEGVFDAARVTNLGYSAVACMSNDMSLQSRKWMWLVRQQRPVVVICDSGAAGLKLVTDRTST